MYYTHVASNFGLLFICVPAFLFKMNVAIDKALVAELSNA